MSETSLSPWPPRLIKDATLATIRWELRNAGVSMNCITFSNASDVRAKERNGEEKELCSLPTIGSMVRLSDGRRGARCFLRPSSTRPRSLAGRKVSLGKSRSGPPARPSPSHAWLPTLAIIAGRHHSLSFLTTVRGRPPRHAPRSSPSFSGSPTPVASPRSIAP